MHTRTCRGSCFGTLLAQVVLSSCSSLATQVVLSGFVWGTRISE
jgi:hypothetical protein